MQIGSRRGRDKLTGDRPAVCKGEAAKHRRDVINAGNVPSLLPLEEASGGKREPVIASGRCTGTGGERLGAVAAVVLSECRHRSPIFIVLAAVRKMNAGFLVSVLVSVGFSILYHLVPDSTENGHRW